MHGRASPVAHDGTGLFSGLPSPLAVTRYHSLIIDPGGVGAGLLVTARTEASEIMAVEHESRPLWGVQFHPEAPMSFGGHRLLANLLALRRGEDPATVRRHTEVCAEIHRSHEGMRPGSVPR